MGKTPQIIFISQSGCKIGIIFQTAKQNADYLQNTSTFMLFIHEKTHFYPLNPVNPTKVNRVNFQQEFSAGLPFKIEKQGMIRWRWHRFLRQGTSPLHFQGMMP
ncbi:MAG: hypothetical protein SPI18_06145 [Prevotella sp.]|nr:hypothetical protein [Prevotella sp.]MDY6130836.1 hypothetical protein [Prevotella sp.]